MWRDVTQLPIEDLDLLAEAGLLWYRMKSSDVFRREDVLPSATPIEGWERVDHTGAVWWKSDYSDTFKWYIREEGS